jgi:DNA repair protein RecN (Recombination protein N)
MKDKYQAEPGELEANQNRLDLINKLKRKYGGSYNEIMSYLDKAISRRNQLAEGEARFSQLRKELDFEINSLKEASAKLLRAREKAARKLEQGIADQLSDLGMKGVRFAVDIEHNIPTENSLKKTEYDRAAFQISANPGEPLKPLAQIASGGEASRVLLAVKTILADVDDIPLLIFDEIDTGVSGQTAGKVAMKLKQISKTRQVFCITHMAQIAAFANQHILIEKVSDGRVTNTSLLDLDSDGRLSELARLLSGGVADNKARELASQLLAAANDF